MVGRPHLPRTASGRFRFAFTLGLCALAVAALVLVIAPALDPQTLGGFAP